MPDRHRHWSDFTLSRRDFVATGLAAAGAPRLALPTAPRPRPTPAQLRWQQDELALFLHFGVNTFSDREWGDGSESPGSFAPAALDARQWARAARAGGFRAMILTAKHHDGFCLWPTRTTTHSVASSPWRGGGGDVARDFVDACRAEGLRVGFYLSPWDRNAPAYGDSPRYDAMYCEQLTELLTWYGPVHEVWFDGANGEGPSGKRQVYDWNRYWSLVRRLQPDAVIFSDAGPDVRWIGNEQGAAGETNWSTVDPGVVPFPGASGDAVMAMLREGDPGGSVWRPGETDTSIRPGWFWHPAEDTRVRTVEQLTDLYFTSVGRNSKLLLNVPPTRDGLLHETDVARLAGMRASLDAIASRDATRGRRVHRTRAGSGSLTVQVDLARPTRPRVVRLGEEIRAGQSVRRYTVEGWSGAGWHRLAGGTTIGYCKLDRVESEPISKVRVRCDIMDDTRPTVGIRVFE